MSSLVPQQSLRSRIQDDFLTCSICFNKFTKPKALPCLHTYCLECLQSYVASFAANGQFPCPMCRQDVVIPAQGLDELPNNRMVSNLAETVEDASQSPEKSCSTPAVPPRPDQSSTAPVVPPRPSESSTNFIRPVPSPRSISPQPPPSSIAPAIPPRPKSVSPVPPAEGNTAGLNTGSHQHHQHTGVTGGNLGKLVTDGIGGVVGAVGSALTDFSGYLKPPKPAPANQQESPMSPFEFIPRPEENVNNSNPHGQEAPSTGLYPALAPGNGAKPCSHGLLLSFGKFGQTVNDLMKPYGLAVGKQGEFVVTDKAGNRVFVFSNTGEPKLRFVAESCIINDCAITVNNKILLAVSKSGSAIMRLYSMDGKLQTSFGNFHKYDIASGITVTPSNYLAVTNLEADNVIVFTHQGKLSVKVGRKGHAVDQFTQPSFVASTSKNYLVVSDTGNNSIKIFDIAGNFKRCFGSRGSNHGQLDSPRGVAVDKDDYIIVADTGNARVEIFTVKGEYYTTIVDKTNLIGPDVRPINVAVTAKNNIAVLLYGTGFCEVRVYQWNPLYMQGHTV